MCAFRDPPATNLELFIRGLPRLTNYDLNFSDSQTFSHFFKKQNGITPEEFQSQSQR